MAKKGAELLHIAQENNLNFLFEASVAAASYIPADQPVPRRGQLVTEIAGIPERHDEFHFDEDDPRADELCDRAGPEARLCGRDPRADVEATTPAARSASSRRSHSARTVS